MPGATAARPPSIGGQAVVEGVMMRGPRTWALAVRTPDGQIVSEAHTIAWDPAAHRVLTKPFLRGMHVLVEQLVIGMRALRISAGYALGQEVEVTQGQLRWAMGVALAVFAVAFIAGPALAGRVGGRALGIHSSVGQNLVEGAIRLGLFLGYVSVISLLPDVRRVYQYHGAEHKTIAAYENGDQLEPEQVDGYSTLHVRCGTNFLFIVLALTVVVGLVVDLVVPHVLGLTISARILLIPVLAGVGYEVIRAASRSEHSLAFRLASLPGLAVQRITTRPPDHGQIQVAIAALQAVVAQERSLTVGDAAVGDT